MPRSASLPALSPRSRIYRLLYETKTFCSKQTLAQGCEISMPTLYQNLSELMDAGLVRYSGEEQSTGGRKARGLEIVPDARTAVGISVMENRLQFSGRFTQVHFESGKFLPLHVVDSNQVVLFLALEALTDHDAVFVAVQSLIQHPFDF